MITRAEREELKALSLEIFGVSSKWKKLLDNGITKQLTKTVVETVPGENGEPDTTREVEVPVLTESGATQSYTKYLSVEEVRDLLLDLKAKRDAFLAERKAKMEEAQAKKAQEDAANKVHEELRGSAV